MYIRAGIRTCADVNRVVYVCAVMHSRRMLTCMLRTTTYVYLGVQLISGIVLVGMLATIYRVHPYDHCRSEQLYFFDHIT